MSEAKLNSFVVYNPMFGTKEGQEHQKIMYYYPESENSDLKVNNVGLCEALVQFAMTFCPSRQCESLHTQKQRQMFFEAEKNFWFIMLYNMFGFFTVESCCKKTTSGLTVSNPSRNVVIDGKPGKEFLESDLSEIVLKRTIERAYKMFRMFYGSLQSILSTEGVPVLQSKLKCFYEKYLRDINVGYMDIMNVFNGVEYFQSNKTTYLKIQSFLDSLTCDFSEIICTLLMYEDKLIWSGLEQSDTHIIYRFLINKFQMSHFENELDCSYLTHDSSCGQFLSGAYSSHPDEPHVADVYIHHQGHTKKAFMVIYKALDITLTLFFSGESEPSTDTLRRLDTALGATLAEFSTVLESFPHQQFDNSEQQVYKFIYFNAGSLSIRSSLHHRDKSGAKKHRLPPDVMKAILTISHEISSKIETSEVISKTISDHWIVAKKLDDRHECYIVTDQKNANLIDVNDEIRKVCQLQISNVLFTD